MSDARASNTHHDANALELVSDGANPMPCHMSGVTQPHVCCTHGDKHTRQLLWCGYAQHISSCIRMYPGIPTCVLHGKTRLQKPLYSCGVLAGKYGGLHSGRGAGDFPSTQPMMGSGGPSPHTQNGKLSPQALVSVGREEGQGTCRGRAGKIHRRRLSNLCPDHSGCKWKDVGGFV